MSYFLIELWSIGRSYTVPVNEFCSSFAKSFEVLLKQKLFQLMLSFLNL